MTITSGAGFAGWGIAPTGIEASLSGSNVDISFTAFAPPIFFIAAAGDTLSTTFALSPVLGGPVYPQGDITTGGAPYPLDFRNGGGMSVAGSIPSVTVPLGYATIQTPAVLTGMAIACTYLAGDNYRFPPPQLPQPTIIADVHFDIPGFLTLTFNPAFGPALHSEAYTAIFSPVPEPSAALLLIGSAVLFLFVRRQVAGKKRS